MHLKRILTSIIAFPLLALLIFKGPVSLFTLFIALISLLAFYEYYRIVFYDQPQIIFSWIPLWGAINGLMMLGAAYVQSFPLLVAVLILNMMGAAALSMPQFKVGPGILNVAEKEIQGVIYIPLPLATIVLLRQEANGVAWIFFLLFIVFAGDVGAFYSGKLLGRHKLSPSISPGKTIEGSMGGMIFCCIIGYIFMRLFLPHLNTPLIFLLFVMANLCGQTGDLFESQLKRVGNIKDSGNMLPGHGGILDRIDALLFAAPVAYFFKLLILSGMQ